jgi:hypothetical protein
MKLKVGILVSILLVFFASNVFSQPGLEIQISSAGVQMDHTVTFFINGESSGLYTITFNDDLSPTLISFTGNNGITLQDTPRNLWLNIGTNKIIATHGEFVTEMEFEVLPPPTKIDFWIEPRCE